VRRSSTDCWSRPEDDGRPRTVHEHQGSAPKVITEFSETIRLLFAVGTVQNTRSRIVEVAVATVAGCDWAGILVVVDGQVTTPIRTEPLVTDLEDLQRQLDQGPCVDALRRGTVTCAGDFALHNTRWPRLGPQAVAEHQAASLHVALANREMIGQAQGILMERERITAEEAFDILRRASQHLNVKLRDVARNLVETGERPDTGGKSGTPNPAAR